jgi:hypothetical protein
MRTQHRILSALLLLSALAPSTLAQTYTPQQIRIDAPAGVDTAEALRIAALPSGVPLTKQQIEAGLQRVVDTGLFSDVAYTVNSDALVIKLTPSASSQLQPAHFSNFVWWQPAELETLVESSVPAYHGKLPSPAHSQTRLMPRSSLSSTPGASTPRSPPTKAVQRRIPPPLLASPSASRARPSSSTKSICRTNSPPSHAS